MFQTMVVQYSQICPFQPQTSNTNLLLEADGVRSKTFWGPSSQREAQVFHRLANLMHHTGVGRD